MAIIDDDVAALRQMTISQMRAVVSASDDDTAEPASDELCEVFLDEIMRNPNGGPDQLHDLMRAHHLEPGYNAAAEATSAVDEVTPIKPIPGKAPVDDTDNVRRFAKLAPGFQSVLQQEFPNAFTTSHRPPPTDSIASLNLSNLSDADLTSIDNLHRRPPRTWQE
ncbi:Uncharacterized protein PBTT_05518 [Plasmodiophora brassicae]|uniref:Uncharacterized protein n=1 Tax=Plasmodiophora brassicae TaxID=37360 RepID=A0A0G4IPT4_PLABS|nr:hypothetical protein PBRA_000713 [Plasmodiophora brassicae]